MTDSNTALAHKERTVADMLSDLDEEERTVFDLVVGAAIEGEDLSDYETIVDQFVALPQNVKYLAAFMVGAGVEENLAHADLKVDNFLAHFGVKGMKWGVRKSTKPASASSGNTTARLSYQSQNTPENRKAARAKVKAGAATMAEAHLAATKSTGHRVVNAMLGDKHYWKRQLQIVGGVVAGVALGTVGVDAMPEGLMSSIGETFAGPGVAGQHVITNSNTGASSIQSNADIGRTLVGATVISVTGGAAYVANQVSQVTNLGRAIFGNKRVDASYAALGKNLKERQTTGSKNIQKTLVKQGGLRKKDLKHDDMLGSFLHAHADVKLEF